MPKSDADLAVTQERLQEVFDYNAFTGEFFWKRRAKGIQTGQRAGCIGAGGYRYIRVDGRHYIAQRLVWLYVNGEWPDRILRFRDGDRTNCAFENLVYPDYPPAATAEYKRANDARHKHHRRRSMLKRNFGISLKEYQSVFLSQNGACAICKQPETEGPNGKPKWLAVDHCHDTGIVRGLLCTACNTTLGRMGDDPARLRAAADYIEKSRVAPAEADNVIRLIARKAS